MVALCVNSKHCTVKTKPHRGVKKKLVEATINLHPNVLFDLTSPFTDFVSRATLLSMHEQYYLPF